MWQRGDHGPCYFCSSGTNILVRKTIAATFACSLYGGRDRKDLRVFHSLTDLSRLQAFSDFMPTVSGTAEGLCISLPRITHRHLALSAYFYRRSFMTLMQSYLVPTNIVPTNIVPTCVDQAPNVPYPIRAAMDGELVARIPAAEVDMFLRNAMRLIHLPPNILAAISAEQ